RPHPPARGRAHTAARLRPRRCPVRLPRGDAPGERRQSRALCTAHPRARRPRRMHLRRLRQLPGRWPRAVRAPAGDRGSVHQLALEAACQEPSAARGAWRFPSLEHPVSRWRGFQRARPLARRMGPAGGRRHLPRDELSLLLPAALRSPRRRFARALAALLGALSRAHGRPRAARGRGALLRLSRPRDGEPDLVSGARTEGARDAAALHRERARSRALRARARRRLSPLSFALWLTGLSGSGKSAIARELVRLLHERGIDAAVLESDAMRTQLTPFPRYDAAERDFFYGALARI